MSTPPQQPSPGDGAQPWARPGPVDPWPHEHGEHPSGASVPDGGVTRAREPRARLIGDPEPVTGPTAWQRVSTWLLLVALVAAVAVAAVVLTRT